MSEFTNRMTCKSRIFESRGVGPTWTLIENALGTKLGVTISGWFMLDIFNGAQAMYGTSIINDTLLQDPTRSIQCGTIQANKEWIYFVYHRPNSG